MQYKIGDVARILGISTDLIRYYEEKGVVKPKKNRENNYRYYDAWDVNFLIDCLWYKKMGFGIDEIAKMTNVETYDDLIGKLSAQGDEIFKAVQHRQMLLKRIRNHTESVMRIKDFLGICDMRENKEFVYYLNRYNYEYDNSPAIQKLNRQWESYMPFSKRLFVIPEKDVLGEMKNTAWGFSLGMDYAKTFGIRAESPVSHRMPELCIHSAFQSSGKNDFTPHHIDFMRTFARQNGLTLCGSAFGYLVCSVLENGMLTGYFEAWLPVSR